MTVSRGRRRTFSKPFRKAIAAAAVMAAALLPSGAAEAGGGVGYWACMEGTWVAQGRPDYPMPLASCPPPDAGEPIRSERACKAKGGEWRAAGIFPQKICILPTIDGGRLCRDDGECEGSCLADLTQAEKDRVISGRRVKAEGTCTPVIPVFGCQAVVEKGYVEGILCLD